MDKQGAQGAQSTRGARRGPKPGSDIAKHGGHAVREKYGPDFYAEIGRKGGQTMREKYGSDFYAEIGKKGGESTKRRQGMAHYAKIGQQGGRNGKGKPRARYRLSDERAQAMLDEMNSAPVAPTA